MNRYALALGGLLAFNVPAFAAPVTWEFIGTGLISCAIPPMCVLPPQNFTLATLVLPSETSSGHATFDANPISRHDVDGKDFGDDFTFRLTGLGPVSRTEPPSGVPQQPSQGVAQAFNISWVEVAGALISAALSIDFTFDNAAFSLDRVNLASDRTLGPCTLTQCTVSGFWQNDLPVSPRIPEPSTLVLLLAGLLALLSLRLQVAERQPG